MPDEPNKKMDEMLRSYAEQRRNAPDVQLHPATRNLLLGEVRRTFRSQERPPWRKRLRAFWPQITFAGSMCLIMCVAILSLRQSPQTEPSGAKPSETKTLRRNDNSATQNKDSLREQTAEARTEMKELAPQAQQSAPASAAQAGRILQREEQSIVTTGVSPPPQPAAGPQPRYLRSDEAAGRERVLTDSANSPQPVAAPAVNLQKKTAGASAKAPEPSKNEAVKLRPMDEPTPTLRSTAARSSNAGLRPEKLSLATDMTNLGAARRLNFVQVSNVSAKGIVGPATNTLLTSFQVEQLGTDVKFLDRDGSVYVGALQATNSADARAPGENPARLASSSAYFFRVQGTNRTLGKDLVLVGEYFEQTNTTPTSLDTFAITAGKETRKKTQPRHLIIGNATVGSTNQIPVRAISNEP